MLHKGTFKRITQYLVKPIHGKGLRGFYSNERLKQGYEKTHKSQTVYLIFILIIRQEKPILPYTLIDQSM